MIDSVTFQECCPAEETFFLFQWIHSFVNFIVYTIFDLFPLDRRAMGLHFFLRTLLKIALLLTLMIYSMGLLRAGLDVEKVRRFLVKRHRLEAFLFAALLGAVTPFCSCSAIPIFIAFTASGIPLGITLSFLITAPLINEVAVVMLITEVGLPFTLLYTITGMMAGIGGGVLLDRIGIDRFLTSDVKEEQLSSLLLQEKLKGRLNLQERHHFAMKEVKKIIGRVWIWLFVGIAVATLFRLFIPASFILNNLSASAWWSVPLAVIVGIPIYSTPGAVVPLAETLLTKGLPVGTTMAFMMSCSAVSLPEFILLSKILEKQGLIYLLLFFLSLFTIVGIFYNGITLFFF